MEASRSWRELLGKIIADPQERQRLADTLNINPITLTRWAAHKSNPRPDNLRPLIEVLPQYRRQLSELITQEFPRFTIETEPQRQSLHQSIPPGFYARVLNANTTSPYRLRANTMRTLILQQAVAQLDPQQAGLIVAIAQCVPPRDGRKVRSLRITQSRATPPWAGKVENRTLLLGAESQAGQALISTQPTIVNSRQTRYELYTSHVSPAESSVVVFPILQSEKTAGCFCVTSIQTQYFMQERLELIQAYTHLLALAFEPEDFFDLQDIELGIMPPNEAQQESLVKFQQRVTQIIKQAAQQGHILTRPQAEILAWQEIEEKFLGMD